MLARVVGITAAIRDRIIDCLIARQYWNTSTLRVKRSTISLAEYGMFIGTS